MTVIRISVAVVTAILTEKEENEALCAVVV